MGNTMTLIPRSEALAYMHKRMPDRHRWRVTAGRTQVGFRAEPLQIYVLTPEAGSRCLGSITPVGNNQLPSEKLDAMVGKALLLLGALGEI